MFFREGDSAHMEVGKEDWGDREGGREGGSQADSLQSPISGPQDE